MKILIYSFNDKIGDGLQKITFLQKIKDIYPNSIIYYTTSQTTTLKDKLNPLVKDIIHEFIENNKIDSSLLSLLRTNDKIPRVKFDLIIDLQKVVLRTLNLRKIPHRKFFSASANFLFSDFKTYFSISLYPRLNFLSKYKRSLLAFKKIELNPTSTTLNIEVSYSFFGLYLFFLK